VRQKNANSIGRTVQCGRHEGGLPLFGRTVRVNAGFQEMVDQNGISVGACQKERRDVVSRRGSDVGTGCNQEIGGIHVVALSRPVQCGRTVSLVGVHVRMLREQSTNGFKVIVFDGLV
jgi:hypothetical protein